MAAPALVSLVAEVRRGQKVGGEKKTCGMQLPLLRTKNLAAESCES